MNQNRQNVSNVKIALADSREPVRGESARKFRSDSYDNNAESLIKHQVRSEIILFRNIVLCREFCLKTDLSTQPKTIDMINYAFEITGKLTFCPEVFCEYND